MSAWDTCPHCGGNLYELYGELHCDTCSWPEDEEWFCERPDDCPDDSGLYDGGD